MHRDETIILFLLSYFVILAILAMARIVLHVIAHWKLFTLAGEPGWKSLIPFYSDFVFYRLVWDVKYFFITFSGSFATALLIEVMENIDNVFFNIFGSLVLLCFSGILLWLNWNLSQNTAKAYGKGKGFGVGLFFLSGIFRLILGFTTNEYHGPQS